MNFFSKVTLLLIFTGLGIWPSLFAQDLSSEIDTTYQNYINQAWQEIRDAEMSHDLQIKYAKEFYEYYQKHPHTETGKNAISSSFMLWGNTKTTDYVEDVLQTLDDDSEIWGNIIFTFSNLYSREEHLLMLEYLSKKITDPRGKSEAILFLLRNEIRSENPDEELTIDLARQLVEIDATEFHVNQGLGYLHELESLNIGQKAPDFTAHTIDGREISLSELEGQFVLLEFWATWCGPCIPEIPHLKILRDRYEESNFEIIGISLDRNEETLTKFIEKEGINWPQILVDQSWKGNIPRLYNVSGIPRMYFLSPDGYILARDLRGEEMVSEIANLVNEYNDR